jgi:UDP-N-acetylglucosamine 2-epimerase (non-hydrolysing)
MVLVYGDTNSTLAGAVASNKLNIPLGHIEAGLRSFDRRMPEETNRVIVDNISNYLFAPTTTGVNNLKIENIFGQVYNTGDLSVEIIENTILIASKSTILNVIGLDPKSYILFTMHRAENTNSINVIKSIIRSFEKIKEKKILFPIHPRTKKIIKELGLYERIQELQNVYLCNPVGYSDFIALMQNALKVVTDSGGVQKEAYLLSVPCITIRENTEWIETVNEGWNVLTGANTNKIVEHIENWQPTGEFTKTIFGNGRSSQIIVEKILESI